MGRVLLVHPGAGSPEALSLEAWRALTTTPAFAAPGDPLCAALRDAGYAVTELEEAAEQRLASEATSGGLLSRNLLAHTHGSIAAGARALVEKLAGLADEHGEISFIVADEVVPRAMMTLAVERGLEVEFVIGRAPRGHRLLELVAVMARLRGPRGCPWDAEQTHQSLAKYLLDETYELLEAIETGTDAQLAEELGDLLLQVVFHAQMGADASTFDIDDVAEGIVAKLVRRHPHVFADVEVSGAREVVENWDEIKRQEKPAAGMFEGVPETLPALAYAQKLQRRSGAAAEDAIGVVRARIDALAAAGPLERERVMGELLFSLVAFARETDIDAESALRRTARAFRDRTEAEAP